MTSFDSFKSITFRERGILAFCVCIAAGVEPVGLHTCQVSLLPLSKTSCCLGDFRQEFGRMSIYISVVDNPGAVLSFVANSVSRRGAAWDKTM